MCSSWWYPNSREFICVWKLDMLPFQNFKSWKTGKQKLPNSSAFCIFYICHILSLDFCLCKKLEQSQKNSFISSSYQINISFFFQIMIPFTKITCVTRERTAFIIPNAIGIATDNEKVRINMHWAFSQVHQVNSRYITVIEVRSGNWNSTHLCH